MTRAQKKGSGRANRKTSDGLKELRASGLNADRHLCKACRFRPEGKSGCGYYQKTNRLRPCDVEFCWMWETTGEIVPDPVQCGDMFHERLIEGIISNAVDDYIDTHKKMYLYPKGNLAAWENAIGSARSFFKSAWFYELTGMDGIAILRKLDERIETLKKTEWRKDRVES